ncbi:MAG: response regulator [Anaerolineae bacterium]
MSEELVYDLLSHLMDSAYLQGHPLTSLVLVEGGPRGEALRSLLVQLIERLRPPAGTPNYDPAWRPYLAIRLRFVELRSPYKVQEMLGLSERQVRREQSRGIAALTALLRERLAATPDEHIGDEEEPGSALRQATQALSLNISSLKVLPLLKDIQQTVRPRLEASAATLMVQADDQLSVFADRVTLRQVLTRIINASIITEPAADLHLTAVHQEESICFRFAVAERGGSPTPLPEEVLAECNVLAELNLGRVWQEVAGNELLVYCTFPAERPLLLLVIDDEEAATKMLRRYVQAYSARVIGLADPVVAPATAARLRPDAIVLDVLMAGRDGWEVLQELRSQLDTQAIPIIVCSVWNEPELALALGANVFLRKPITRAQFVQALRRVLPNGSAARFLAE